MSQLSILAKNIDYLMSRSMLSALSLAKKINIPPSTIKKIRNSNQPNPTIATLLPIANYFEIGLDVLLKEELAEQEMLMSPLPKLFTVFEITWPEIKFWPDIAVKTSVIPTDTQYSKSAFAVRLQDDMNEQYSAGGVLIIDPGVKPQHGDEVMVEKAGLIQLKRLLIEDGHSYLKSIRIQPHAVLRFDDFRMIGPVMEYRVKVKSDESIQLTALPQKKKVERER